MRVIFTLIFIFSSTFVFSQLNIDSLKKAIENMEEKEQKVDAQNKLAWEYAFNKPAEALSICELSMDLAKQLKYKKGIAESYNIMGAANSVMGKNDKALSNYIESLKIKEELKDVRGVGIGLINIGMIYSDQEQYTKALDYYLKALEQFKKINNETEIAATYNSLGTLFVSIEQVDSGKMYIERAIELRNKLNDVEGLAESYENLAIIHKRAGNYRMALKYFDLVQKFNRESRNEYERAITLNNMSILHQELNDLDKAIRLATESSEISTKNGYLESLKYSYGNLASFYREKKDYATAYHFLAVYFSVVDSLKNEALSRSLNDLSIKYETDKKEQENKLLQAQNELSEKTIRQQRIQFYVIVGGLMLSIIFIGFVIRSNRQKQRYNQIITQQKQEVELQKIRVEEKHKEITDSINYAERIQRSFLASRDLLDSQMKEYFVLFQPKDVVSGDFYWAWKLSNGNFLIAAADSTGHGVPGAIMSILNISCLEKAVEEDNRTEPALILDLTRKRIIERLKKDGSVDGGKDGMDCSLLCFDFKAPSLTYSAANNPVWVVRNKEVIELAPDKMPVGKHDKDQIPFKQHHIDLQSGDMVYAFTDGMPDQFGGPLGKKFMYKRLKELLVSVSNRSAKEQEDVIRTELDQWKGELEQVDDVTVIGIRI